MSRVNFLTFTLLISSFLTTAKAQEFDLVDTAINAGNFTTLVAAADLTGLTPALRAPGELTVFAPTDDAFAKLPQEVADFLFDNPLELQNVLLYHAAAGALLAEDVLAEDTIATLLGETVSISVTGDGAFVNDAQITQTDVLATNGVIHVIDTVLIPPGFTIEEPVDIVDTAIAAGAFSTLVAAVQAAGLEDTLRGDGPFTVFAPTDDAFAALGQDVIDGLLGDIDALTDVLLYHVVAGALDSATVVGSTTLMMANGDEVEIRVEGDQVFINQAQIISVDVEASNGIIHVIDAVLIPPTDDPEPTLDLLDTAAEAGNFTTLLAAVDAAGIADALRGPGPYTVFAPTDDAFAAVPAEILDFLLANPTELANVLLYHAVSGQVLAEDVVNLTGATTLNGEDVEIEVIDGQVFVNQAQVIATDILATNGVIHVLDAVLLPPSFTPPQPNIVEVAASVDRFSTLVAAVEAAGLADALQGDGPFTVFAPNNDAFAKIPADTLNALLNDPDALAEILLYHVSPGALTADDVLARNRLRTLQGQFTDIEVNDAGAFINDAQIIATDILASNGVIHEIDTVILPPDMQGFTYEITVTNITKGQIFSPPAVVAHQSSVSLFTLGNPASQALAALAEDGFVDPILDEAAEIDGVFSVNAFDGPILPGDSATLEINTFRDFNTISVLGMLVITNDAFFAATAQAPGSRFTALKTNRFEPFTEVIYATAYDAGTEENTESCGDIPGPPCGSVGTGTPGEGYVYVSNGIHNVGDIDSATYDWRGPVARVVIRLKR